jgi:hypothetical protein
MIVSGEIGMMLSMDAMLTGTMLSIGDIGEITVIGEIGSIGEMGVIDVMDGIGAPMLPPCALVAVIDCLAVDAAVSSMTSIRPGNQCPSGENFHEGAWQPSCIQIEMQWTRSGNHRSGGFPRI